jgi:succinate-semialdehyde dehydrogenase / glutarate-semialdehyde dehydrogenase
MIASVNPATGEVLRNFQELTPQQLDRKLAFAEEAWGSYRRTSLAERARWLNQAAAILESEKERIGRIITLEMGKPIGAARSEVEKCASACRYYAENGERLLAPETVDAGPGCACIRYDPIGPVLAVMPWNFPLWQAFRFAAPALMAGNVGLLKHSSNVPQCAVEIESVMQRAGFPGGCFQTLLAGSAAVRGIIEDPRVKAVTLTGSEPAGAQVASQAGAQIKKTVLELGGSDPFIVMPSAHLSEAIRTGVSARIVNNGQSCIAAKRFIVDERIADEFESGFVAGMKALSVGDPMNEATEVGPLATQAILEDLEKQVSKSVEMGAALLAGGKRIPGKGYFYEPTVLANVPKDSPAYKEELFGPAAVIFRVNGIEEAIEQANDTSFGLGASAWTTDAHEQHRFIEDLQAGMVFINGMVSSDPRLPFGGVKRSGYGRELGGHGIREFVNIKTVRVLNA